MLIDKHDSLENIMQRAEECEVKFLQTICTKLEEFPHILSIAKQYSNIYTSVGVHPSEVKSKVLETDLLSLTTDDRVIGIGETGLDYFYNKDPQQQELQRLSFIEHIKASQATGLPVIIHTRDAEEDSFNIINEMMKKKEFSALIHCFTASGDFAEKMLNLGLYISVSGIVTFKNAVELQNIIKKIPLNRLLIETDAPYLAPVPKRGKTNEPSYVKHVAQFLADLKGIDIDEVAKVTTDNFFELFKVRI
jgi:TatD DNase family protein